MPAKKTAKAPARAPKAKAAPTSVNDLSPNPKNPRKDWSGPQQAAFKKSLEEFGDLSGIVFNLTTGQLVGGHKRVIEFQQDEAPQLVKETTLAAAAKDGTLCYGHVTLKSGARFAYREVKWPKAKEAAANLAANKWAADWDWEGVSGLLEEAKAGDFDLELTGFTSSEFEPLLAADWAPPAAGAMPENKPTTGKGSPVDGEHHPHHIGLSDEAYGALANVKKKGRHKDWSSTILALCGK